MGLDSLLRCLNDTLGNSYSNSTNQGQFFGGGQVGFNYQFPMGVVIGAEWQFDWLPNASNTGNGTAIPGVGTVQVTSNNRWVTDVAARLGYGWDRVLFIRQRRLGLGRKLTVLPSTT